MKERRHGSGLSRLKFLEVKIVAADAEVFDDVGNDAARNIAWMPGEGDETVGAKWVGIVAVTARSAEKFAADFTQAAFKLAAIP